LTVKERQWLDIILGHDVIFIDGIQYLRREEIEAERLGTSNAYRVSQKMQRQNSLSIIGGNYYAVRPINFGDFGNFAYVSSGNDLLESGGLVVYDRD
jgi:hypothetical protein